jgi:para-aminobenzoate synthetase
MQIISRFEKRKRGVYTGCIGYLGYDGTMNLNIAIRTILVEPGRVSLGAGGAIVADSDPEIEWEEIIIKAEAVFGKLARRRDAKASLRPA